MTYNERLMRPFVYVLQHISIETLGVFSHVLEDRGVEYRYVRVFQSDPVPKELGDASGVIVMGGPMGVYESETYPFLLEEARLLEHALKEEKGVLGVCLGSQLLAQVLGSSVKKGPQKEIGWYTIQLNHASATDKVFHTLPRRFTGFLWHGDVFDCPSGAQSLASSELASCQAFSYQKNAYGLLFHLETTQTMMKDMIETFSQELEEERIDGREILENASRYLSDLHAFARSVFSGWVEETLLPKAKEHTRK